MIALRVLAATAVLLVVPLAGQSLAQTADGKVRTGAAAFGDWRQDAPGVARYIRPDDLPAPHASASSSNSVNVVRRPNGAALKVPPGFAIEQYASGLNRPRLMRVAPNGDVFVAETSGGRIKVMRAKSGAAKPDAIEVFASGLGHPFGIAFYPSGENPQWVYVASTDQVVRIPYRSGDLKARGKPEVIVSKLPTGGHSTRDVVFSKDGTRMFVSVGSDSNVGESMGRLDAKRLQAWQTQHTLGAAWGDEEKRAAVLAFDPQGKNEKVFATGIRNCVGMAVQPATGDLWCSTNERDGLGDNLVPDHITRVREGAFYGWPWYYIGAHEDPRLKGQRPDLKDKVTVPDVLIQAHSASMQLAFYDGSQFPAEYRGDAFAAEHGSWNRSHRTGYKVIRVRLKDGKPTGVYEDFITGFVVDDGHAWGRPVGVAVLHDGSLLVSEDGNGTIWRVTYRGAAAR
jgi:glucose/arabinose dehydrogenase